MGDKLGGSICVEKWSEMLWKDLLRQPDESYAT